MREQGDGEGHELGVMRLAIETGTRAGAEGAAIAL